MDHSRLKNWRRSRSTGIKKVIKPLHDRLGRESCRTPFTDEHGVIRDGGREDEAFVSYDSKHPAVLPRDHWISLLIIRHFHQIGHADSGL